MMQFRFVSYGYEKLTLRDSHIQKKKVPEFYFILLVNENEEWTWLLSYFFEIPFHGGFRQDLRIFSGFRPHVPYLALPAQYPSLPFDSNDQFRFVIEYEYRLDRCLSVCLPFCQLAASAGRRQTASQLAIYEISNLISCFLFSSLPLRPSHLTLTLFCSCFINQSTSVQFRVFLLTPIKLLWISRSLTFEHRYRLNLPFQGV